MAAPAKGGHHAVAERDKERVKPPLSHNICSVTASLAAAEHHVAVATMPPSQRKRGERGRERGLRREKEKTMQRWWELSAGAALAKNSAHAKPKPEAVAPND
ncbi:hypothetical protein PIB30_004702 [Stylosanthes scabra]|uniref:Uncharacterized protein n=1 Tax=Stylosanthes scabra TaxID=79078 RepID=A0ABU6R2N9_9FABA|nr:hypothetical protein [Stylosanthes scabra]